MARQVPRLHAILARKAPPHPALGPGSALPDVAALAQLRAAAPQLRQAAISALAAAVGVRPFTPYVRPPHAPSCASSTCLTPPPPAPTNNSLPIAPQGDPLAGELLLLHSLSRVHTRVEPMALGALSISVAGVGAPEVAALLAVLRAIQPRVVHLPLTIPGLNRSRWAPHKARPPPHPAAARRGIPVPIPSAPNPDRKSVV